MPSAPTWPGKTQQKASRLAGRPRSLLSHFPLEVAVDPDALLHGDEGGGVDGAHRVEQLLINLMENAIVHSKSAEPVECYVDSSDSQVTFHVRDYGIGIPPERLTTIFDGSSSTTSTSTDGRKGMGIGLSICKTIISAHGGTICAVNHEHGAEFYFSLPKEVKKNDS